MRFHLSNPYGRRLAFIWIGAILLVVHAARAAQTLDGSWLIATDPYDIGQAKGWWSASGFPESAARPIPVPGNIYEAFSGYNGIVWYSRTFVPAAHSRKTPKAFLQFGAVQYSCEVWLNGQRLGAHEGASSPFEFDVTPYLRPGRANRVTLRIFSPTSFFRNGGKYPVAFDMGGITQGVTMAYYPELRIRDVFARPNADHQRLRLDVTLDNYGTTTSAAVVKAVCSERKSLAVVGKETLRWNIAPGTSMRSLVIAVPHPHEWSPDDPFLYSVYVSARVGGAVDTYIIPHVGFRELTIDAAGYFRLNHRRIFIRSTHGNVYDPIVIQGTPGDMTYLERDARQLKRGGFNMERFICYSALPEQLDIADKLGLMVYDEHQGSWICNAPSKFAVDLPGVIRRDRNHPSLVIWGLLNENQNHAVYEAAKHFLPRLRQLDPTRLVFLSSGRWDEDFTTGAASNPHTSVWGVYLGGEDPVHPVPTGRLRDMGFRRWGAYSDGGGDLHVYQRYPTSWRFIEDFAHLSQGARPFFLSEGGCGAAFNVVTEFRKLEQATGGTETYENREWVNPMFDALRQVWRKYDMGRVYGSMEDLLTASEIQSAKQRELFFSVVRSNPRVNGYNLSGMTDNGGCGQGVMDAFRVYKPDMLHVVREGWAKLRWCLFVHPTQGYAGEPFRIRVVLANDDVLKPGEHRVDLEIAGPAGTVWRKSEPFAVSPGEDAPLAYPVLDEKVPSRSWPEGVYTLKATLESGRKAAANQFDFRVADRRDLPSLKGCTVTVLGLEPAVRTLLMRQGATLRDYREGQAFDREVIVVGGAVSFSPKEWRQLYTRIARGAQAIFLCGKVFRGERGMDQWLALPRKGTQSRAPAEASIFHPDFVALPGPMMAGLPKGIMTPQYFSGVLNAPLRFQNVTHPDQVAGVAIYCTKGKCLDWVTLGAYQYHHGGFIINALNLTGSVGNPAADRILVNLVQTAAADAVNLKPAPAGLDTELNAMGIR